MKLTARHGGYDGRKDKDMVRIVEAYDKDGAVVAWSDVPKAWSYTDEEIVAWYKLQIEREKGIKVTAKVLR